MTKNLLIELLEKMADNKWCVADLFEQDGKTKQSIRFSAQAEMITDIVQMLKDDKFGKHMVEIYLKK